MLDGDADGVSDADCRADGVGDADCAADGEGDTATEGDAAGDGDELCETVGEAVVPVEDGVGLVCPGAGRNAIDPVDEAANAAAASVRSPMTAAIGTSATPRPSGKRSRQLGQKPETGVVT
jgi:hypothetical protein